MTDIQALIATASDDAVTSYERRNAITLLGDHDDPATLTALIRLLALKDRYLRQDVVKSIGSHRSDSAVLALIHCLSDESDNLRRDAARYLGEKGDGRAIGPLKQLLDGQGYAVRRAAESSLEQLAANGITEVPIHEHELSFLIKTAESSASGNTTQQVGKSSHHDLPETPNSHDPPNEMADDVGQATQQISSPTVTSSDIDQTPTQTIPSSGNIHETEAADPRPQPGVDLQLAAAEPDTPTEPTATEESEPQTSRSDSQINDENTEQKEDLEPDSSASPSSHAQPTTRANTDDVTENEPGNNRSPKPKIESLTAEQVLVAEIVTENGNQAGSTGLHSFEQRCEGFRNDSFALPTPPENFDWSTAHRFHAFFGARWHHLPKLYSELESRQTTVILAEAEFEKATFDHNVLYSDLTDDVRNNAEKQTEENAKAEELAKEAKAITREYKQIRERVTGIVATITDKIWPKRLQAMKQLAEALKQRRVVMAQETDRNLEARNTVASESEDLRQPLEEVDTNLINANIASRKANARLSEISDAINNLILSKIVDDTESAEDLDAMVSNITSGPLLQQCRTELLMHVARLKSLAADLVDLEFPISEGTNIYEEAVQNLANNIANGFTYQTKQHKQKTTFNCSVSFASAKNSIRPSQRVFGKAQGRARLEVEFESERMGWNGGKNLSEAIHELNKLAMQSANDNALYAVRAAELAATNSAKNECLWFIRTELEKDFGESA